MECLGMNKVLHISKGFPPTNGGIENATRSFAMAAIEIGCDTRVLCYGDTSCNKVWNGVQIKEIAPLFKFLGQPLSFKFILEGLICGLKSDCVHLHVPDYSSHLIGIFIKLFQPNKTIFLHWHADVMAKGWLGSKLRFIELILASKAKFVIFGSPDYFHHSYLKGKFDEKIKIIEYPVSINFEYSNLVKERNNEMIHLLSVGRLVEYKGFEQLISMLISNLRLKLIIVGSGPLKLKLDGLVNLLDLKSRVLILEGLSEKELWQEYANADIFILNSQSRAESFGIVLVEALSQGLKLLTRKVSGSGMNFVNNNHEFGTIYEDFNNIESLAINLLHNGKSRIDVSEYGLNRFGFKQFLEKVRNMYEV